MTDYIIKEANSFSRKPNCISKSQVLALTKNILYFLLVNFCKTLTVQNLKVVINLIFITYL